MSSLPAVARTTCRACGTAQLTPVFSLGNHNVSNFVEVEEGVAIPLDLVLCDVAAGGCGLLQLRHTVARELLYTTRYWYRSGINESMRRALADIARKGEQAASLRPGDIVLDIGCNDGTLLRSYTTPQLQLVGFESAVNLMSEARAGTSHIFNEFFRAEPFCRRFNGAKAALITSIAMFYDLDDPNEFIADIAACLRPDGIWLIEMSYLPLMLKRNILDNICHEHLTYYSLFTLRPLLRRHGLDIVDVELNDVNGGSFRVYVRHQTSARPLSARLAELERRERPLGLNGRPPYDAFARRALDIKTELLGFIQREVGRGRTVYVYGASTKGNTLLQFCGLDHRLITAAADRNPDKWGKKTVGTLIPIISEEEARAERPDFFLILPWHFLTEFLERERAFLERGGQFIVPLPSVRVISQYGVVPLELAGR